MRLPWANWDSYEMGLVEHPIVTKTAINAVIYLIGDWMSQVHTIFFCLPIFVFCRLPRWPPSSATTDRRPQPGSHRRGGGGLEPLLQHMPVLYVETGLRLHHPGGPPAVRGFSV